MIFLILTYRMYRQRLAEKISDTLYNSLRYEAFGSFFFLAKPYQSVLYV